MARSFTAASSEYIDAGGATGSLNVATNSQISFVCWVNFRSLPANQTMFAKGYDPTPNSTAYSLGATSTPTITGGAFNAGTNNGIVWNGGASIVTNTWFHFYVEYNSGTQLWAMYVNGTTIGSNGPIGGPISLTNPLFFLGAVQVFGTGPTQFLDANGMADCAVFDRPLNSTDIGHISGLTLGGGANSAYRANAVLSTGAILLGYWPLLSSDASSAPDYSTGGHNGTLHGTSTTADPIQLQAFGFTLLPPTFTQSPILQIRNQVLSY
jgi:hypothetical protein